MNIYAPVTKDNLAEEADLLWPAVCRILNVEPGTLIKPRFSWVTDETLELIDANTAALGPDRQTIYLSDNQEITLRILGHEMAHYVMVKTEKDEGEFVPQWLEEQLANV